MQRPVVVLYGMKTHLSATFRNKGLSLHDSCLKIKCKVFGQGFVGPGVK